MLIERGDSNGLSRTKKVAWQLSQSSDDQQILTTSFSRRRLRELRE